MAESGEIRKPVGISVTTQGSKVIIQFDREVGYLRMSPQQAGELSRAVGDKAESIASEASIYINPVGISVKLAESFKREIIVQFDQMVGHLELVPERAAELCYALAMKVEEARQSLILQ